MTSSSPLPDDVPVALSMLAVGWVRSNAARRWPRSAQEAFEFLERSELMPEDKAVLGEMAGALWERDQKRRERWGQQGGQMKMIDAMSVVEGNAASVRLTERVADALEQQMIDADTEVEMSNDGSPAEAARDGSSEPGDKTMTIPADPGSPTADRAALVRQGRSEPPAQSVRRGRRVRRGVAAVAACALLYFWRAVVERRRAGQRG